MNLYTSRKKTALSWIRKVLPFLLLAVILVVFVSSVNQTSRDTLDKEQATLERALQKSAVHAYALTGRYPESLSSLLDEYGITYDHTKFVVDYMPSGSNLLPQITVIRLGAGKEAKAS